MGLKEYTTISNGMRITNPRISNKSKDKLKTIQRRPSNKRRGGKNRGRAKIKLARISEYIARQQDDFLHKTSHHLVNSCIFIKYKELKIANMGKNHHHLARQIADVSWGNPGGLR